MRESYVGKHMLEPSSACLQMAIPARRAVAFFFFSLSRLPSEEDALPLLLCKYSQTLYDSVLDTCPNRECSAEERIDRILFRALCLLNCYGREKGIHLSSGHINSVFQLWSSSSAMWHFVTTKEPDP
jgi:hypothetical protein